MMKTIIILTYLNTISCILFCSSDKDCNFLNPVCALAVLSSFNSENLKGNIEMCIPSNLCNDI